MKYILFLFLLSPILAFAQADKDKPTRYLTFSSGLTFGHRQVVTRFPEMAHIYNGSNSGSALAVGWEQEKSKRYSNSYLLQFYGVAVGGEKYKVVSAKIPLYTDLEQHYAQAISASFVLKRKHRVIDIVGGLGLDLDIGNLNEILKGIPKQDSNLVTRSYSDDKKFVYSEISPKRGVLLNPFVLVGINKDIRTGRKGKFSFSLLYQQGLLHTHSKERSYIDYTAGAVLHTSIINFRGSNTRFMLSYAHEIGRKKDRQQEKILKPDASNPKALRNKLSLELGFGVNYAMKRATERWAEPIASLSERSIRLGRQCYISFNYRKSPTSPWVYGLRIGTAMQMAKIYIETPRINGSKFFSWYIAGFNYNYAAFVLKRHLGKNWWAEGGLALAWDQPLYNISPLYIAKYGYPFTYPNPGDNIIVYVKPIYERIWRFNQHFSLGITKAIRFFKSNELFFNLTYNQGLLSAASLTYMAHYQSKPQEQFLQKYIFRGSMFRGTVGYRFSLKKKR